MIEYGHHLGISGDDALRLAAVQLNWHIWRDESMKVIMIKEQDNHIMSRTIRQYTSTSRHTKKSGRFRRKINIKPIKNKRFEYPMHTLKLNHQSSSIPKNLPHLLKGQKRRIVNIIQDHLQHGVARDLTAVTVTRPRQQSASSSSILYIDIL